MNEIRILIADDHNMVREGLKQLIELEDDIIVVSQAKDGFDAIEKIKLHEPDVVLLDINMPIMNGLDVLKELKSQKIETNIIMLTLHNDVEYLHKAVGIGVKGYVLKDSEADVLIKAIRDVYKGESYIQPNMAAKLFKKLNDHTEKLETREKLTKREIEVLKLITEGMLNKEIAYKLSISEKTVKNHISNIFKKIEVSDRTQAAVYAIKNKVVDLFEK